MQPQTDADYKKIFTELIKKQMIVLGPDITLAKVKNVQGLDVNSDGEVTNINGDAQNILQLLINQFVELSGTIVKKTMESILTTYPGMASMAASSITPNVSTPPQQVSPVNQPQNNQSQPPALGANPFSDPVSQNQPLQNTPTPSDVNSNQMPKEDMDSINKALSDLSRQPVGAPTQPTIENSSNNMQQSNNS